MFIDDLMRNLKEAAYYNEVSGKYRPVILEEHIGIVEKAVTKTIIDAEGDQKAAPATEAGADEEKTIENTTNWREYNRGTEAGKAYAVTTIIGFIDKEIALYKTIGGPGNQHRDIVNAFMDFRRRVMSRFQFHIKETKEGKSYEVSFKEDEDDHS